MKEAQIVEVTNQSSDNAKIKDLEALYMMANYLREGLLRVGSQGFWTTAFLPSLIQYEISELQLGRPLRPIDIDLAGKIPSPEVVN